MKNIVICCDGTNNQLSSEPTNVIRLFEVVVKDKGQVAFYDPGVGTMASPWEQGFFRKRWSLIRGLAFGSGLDDNVFDAYRFLMREYEPGDQVFIFGFSRGAFTARVLAGMLSGVGLLRHGAENLLPYLWQTYRALPGSRAGIDLIKRSFTRPCPVTFLGPWDTVGSVGLYNWNQSFPFTYENRDVAVVRHAVSLDERRAGFRSNVVKADLTPTSLPSKKPRVMNVWFPGVHSDIGGGYKFQESGLAMLAFEWMVREAKEAGLRVDETRLQQLLNECPPDPGGMMHRSLKRFWWLVELLPARRYDWEKGKSIWRYQPNKPRLMINKPGTHWLHQSVKARMDKLTDYRPKSLPENHTFPTES